MRGGTRGFALSLSALFSLMICAPAWSQEFPARAIRIVVPVAAGGSPDVLARIIGEQMRTRLGNEGAEVTLMSPEAFTGMIRSEITKYRKVVQDRNLKPG